MKGKHVLLFCTILSFLGPFFTGRGLNSFMKMYKTKVLGDFGYPKSMDTRTLEGINIGMETETELQTEIGMETETELQTEIETESETELQTEIERESETELQTESETEILRIITVESVKIAYENNTRAYDGTDLVELDIETRQTAEGDVRVLASGRAKAGKVGTWSVKVSYELIGKDAKNFQLEKKDAKLKVHIIPKVLQVEIANASKEYFSEPKIGNLAFEDGIPQIKITGFVEEGRPTENFPKGFVMPELEIDTAILNKDSPMFRNGKIKEYQGALVLKTGKNGKVSGKTTSNYCYKLEEKSEYYQKGTIVLYPVETVTDKQYQITVQGGNLWEVGDGRWIQRGSQIAVTPLDSSGFNEVILSEPLQQSGEFTCTFRRVDSKGNLTACSEPQQIPFLVDDGLPEFSIYMNKQTEFIDYSKDDVLVSVSETRDQQSGIRLYGCFISSKYYTDEDLKGMLLNREAIWETGRNEMVISKEGEYYFYAGAVDQVGNTTVKRSSRFTIDKTMPNVQIDGVKDKSANAGKVNIRISFQDVNLSEDMLQVVIRGNQGKAVQLHCKKIQKKNKTEWTFEDFPHERSLDDRYMLEVQAEDKAGNKIRKTIDFSINRFGSVYLLSEETKEILKQFYIRTPSPIIIKEINVDRLEDNTITVAHDGTIKQLKEKKDYIRTQKNGTYDWKEYEYQILKDCFDGEGLYTIILSSEDAAQNLGDSRKEKGNIEFFIDKTPPSCIISGIEQNKTYIQNEKEITVLVNDNGYLQNVRILLNGFLIREGQEKRYSVNVKSNDEWQALQVYASDKAGNEIWTKEVKFLLFAGEMGGSLLKSQRTIQTTEAGTEDEIQKAELLMETHGEKEVNRKNENKIKPYWIFLICFSAASVLLFSLKKIRAK